MLDFVNKMSAHLATALEARLSFDPPYDPYAKAPPFNPPQLARFFSEWRSLAFGGWLGTLSERDSALALDRALRPFGSIAPVDEGEWHSRNDGSFSGAAWAEERRVINTLAILAGNSQVLDALVAEIVDTERFPGLRNPAGGRGSSPSVSSPYPRLKELFPSGRPLDGRPSLLDVLDVDGPAAWPLEQKERVRQMLLVPPIQQIATRVTEHYGLPAGELLSTWRLSDIATQLEPHLLVIRAIEREQRGAARQLFDEPSGIRCFGRYSPSALLEQLRPLEIGKPYGVMCSAVEDENGAFMHRSAIHAKLERAAAKLGMNCRITEYSEGDKSGLYQKLSMMAQVSGGGVRQAAFVWINEHGQAVEGDPRALQQERAHWSGVFGRGTDATPLVIKGGAAVSSFMCFAGESGNAMQAIALEYPVRTSGATLPPHDIRSISLKKRKDGSLSFNVRYRFPKDQSDGRTASYDKRNGRRAGREMPEAGER